jgi:glucosamine kinase
MRIERLNALPAGIEYVIGIDGGGTSTRARVLHRSGVVLGEGRAGPSGLMQGVAQAWRHIAHAVQAAVLAGQGTAQAQHWPRLQPANSWLGAGLAGAPNPGWHTDWLAGNPGYARVALASDAATALRGAHGGAPGALVVMGTGAIALARDADGTLRTVGGWGFPSGDEGSGAHLGLLAVSHTQRAVDGRAAHTPLTQAVYRSLGGTPVDLLTWCGQAAQHAYARLAPLVFELAAGGDALAQRLLHGAAQALLALAHTANPQGLLPLVVAGSVGQRLLHDRARQPQTDAPLAAALAALPVVPARGDAMDGAIDIVLEGCGA